MYLYLLIYLSINSKATENTNLCGGRVVNGKMEDHWEGEFLMYTVYF